MSATNRRARYREQREQTRREILAAAERLLRERPYRELSVEAVMAGTGLTRTAFYRHFDDVPDLVLRVLEEVLGDLYAVGERWSAQAGGDTPAPGPALEALGHVVDFFAEHGPLLRAVTAGAATDEQIERGLRRMRAPFIELTAQTLDRLVARGTLTVPDTRAMATALNLMNEAYLLDEFGREGTGDRAVALETVLTVWVRTLGSGSAGGSDGPDGSEGVGGRD